MSQPATSTRTYTYSDYVLWPEDGRWELINGIAHDMSPAPSINHQEIVLAIAAWLRTVFEARPCRVFVSPVDVLLSRNGQSDVQTDTVVQPDVLVVCDQDKLTDKHVRGAPDLVVEVLSPSTAKKDEGLKRDIYEAAGVMEYWLVHPNDHTINRYTLRDHQYGRPDVYGRGDEMNSTCFPECLLVLNDIFGLSDEPDRMSPPE